MDFEREQREIRETVNSVLHEHSGVFWGKFQGDVIPRILAHYMAKHIPGGYRTVFPNVFVRDNPIEFDLIIVNYDSRPDPFTSAFPREDVRGVIEVKRIGIIAKQSELKDKIAKIRSNFDSVTLRKARLDCKAAYLSISETINPARPGSIRFGDITRDVMQPHPAFILYDLGCKRLVEGEWKRFIEYITSDL